MRNSLAAFLVILCSLSWANAQESEGDVKTVIQGQIDAFLADDFEAAFLFASPRIKQIFGSAQNFGAMVRGGYPMVWRPAEVLFLDQEEFSGATWQKLRIVDSAGDAHWLAYEMIDVDGEWRINGVYLIDAPEVNA